MFRPLKIIPVLATLGQIVLTIEPNLAEDYLTKYGYITQPTSEHSSNIQRLDTAVTQFQVFAGLDQTGEFDRKTEETMMMRRCGVKDIGQGYHRNSGIKSALYVRSRHKRYALQGSRWKKRTLTYRITKYPSKRKLSRNDVDINIKKAFNVWMIKTNLNFVKRRFGRVDIEIRFEKRSHEDEDDFDGIGGTLAHAYFPVYGGDVHFDDDEDWTVNSYHGTSLLMSAAHELGHVLGLAHSNVRGSLMSPFYTAYEQDCLFTAMTWMVLRLCMARKCP